MKNKKNILVIRFSSLGDLVTLEPTFRAIKYFYANCKITFLTTKIGYELFKDSSYFNSYVIYENIFKTTLKLRNESFDLVFNIQNNKPSLILAHLLDSKLTINKSYTLIDKLFNRKPQVKNFIEMIIASGISKENTILYDNDESKIVHLPHQKILDLNNQNLIAISVGSSAKWLSKQWPLEKYIQLIQFLVSHKIKVVLIGSKLEEKAATEIEKQFKGNIINLVDKTTLGELKNILSSVKLFIGNDSGPAHLAAGTGTPTITLFGPTDIKHCVKNLPYLGHHICIKPEDTIVCHPCYKSICPTAHECMQNIHVDKVVHAIKSNFPGVTCE